MNRTEDHSAQTEHNDSLEEPVTFTAAEVARMLADMVAVEDLEDDRPIEELETELLGAIRTLRPDQRRKALSVMQASLDQMRAR